MVRSSHIDLHTLPLDELVGVVNLYPWYGAAHIELCSRMSEVGGDDWGLEQFAGEALFVADRSKIAAILHRGRKGDYSDKDVQALLASYMGPAPEETSAAEHQVRVVGGDYFSQSQYDNVRKSGDNIFTRFAAKARPEGSSDEEAGSEMADRFATETLARIFAEQGRPEEARRIYSRLVLDIPEKSAYFASLIDELD